MALKILIIIICSGVISSIALGSTFETMEGMYRVISCKNNATNPSPFDLPLCDNSQLTISSAKLGATFSFSRIVQSDVQVRSFDLPRNMALYPNGKYLEKGDFYAAFTNEDKVSGEIFVMKKKAEGKLYHLSMHRRSEIFKTFDMFEIDLEKMTDQSEIPELPPVSNERDKHRPRL